MSEVLNHQTKENPYKFKDLDEGFSLHTVYFLVLSFKMLFTHFVLQPLLLTEKLRLMLSNQL
jgi:hypothetical protein